MKIVEYFSVNNDCYKSNVNKVDSRYTNFQKNGPQGLMLHSVGCAQDDALVFAKSWNKANKQVAVHAVLQANGTVYQCLPWNYRGWHAGGAANNTHVGVEMTEPDCIKYGSGGKFTCSDLAKAKEQVQGTYETAVELFAYLCKLHKLNPLADGVIISHSEGYQRGVASNHGDPEHLWKQLGMGYTMDGFRKDVAKRLNTPEKVDDKMYIKIDVSNKEEAEKLLNLLKNAEIVGIKPEPVKKTVDELAREVWAGKWGNGTERTKRLTEAGYDYKAVQKRVNELYG